MLSDQLLLLASLLVFAAVLITKVGARLGAPSLLLFLILGMVAGADGLGLEFDRYEIAESIGHFAMTVILFAGGLETSLSETKPVIRQGVLLSTVGIILTTAFTGIFIYLTVGNSIGGVALTFLGSLMIAAIMSSTDSASVFSILRGKNLNLRENLGPMLELESGSNDPMAFVLTIILVGVFSTDVQTGSGALLLKGAGILMVQLVVGLAIGLLVGYLSKWVLEKVDLENVSLYAIMVFSIGFLANALASILHGNGLLSLYIAAVIIGNQVQLKHRRDVLKFSDAMTWVMQLMMFLMLGLLARPSHMLRILGPALLIGLFMLFIARPMAVYLTLLPFRKMSFRAKTFVSWVGLKGAGPILFALTPVVAGLEGATDIFNIVFVISLLSLILQGFSLPIVARWLKLSYDADPQVETFGMEIPEEMGMLRDHTVLEEELGDGKTLRDLHLPHGIRVMMVRRGERFLVPHGSMELLPGDHLMIILGESDD